ncbi:hypothetical protein GCM10011491_04190 [Brucella endophytica]|uniref:N-acetyltransferase domain-containing protein n=1 Tax=Brucella endophytica TaxID=1963359 RepID=A0A916S2B8_9HYPH|nr:GNAT family N-acetyltransferase [Brucella endophytica]GGA80070.1 hypothetical protein GCM10011491_04190 [Brucella endophytica]
MIKIEALGQRPELIPTCARWNYDQWGRQAGRSLDETVAGLEQIIAGDKQEALVAQLDGTPCGMVLLIDCDLSSHQHLKPWVASVLVQPDFRGRGVGRELLAAIERAARELGFQEAYLYTAKPQYYHRMGWEIQERFTDGGEELSIMSKSLQL